MIDVLTQLRISIPEPDETLKDKVRYGIVVFKTLENGDIQRLNPKDVYIEKDLVMVKLEKR